MCRIVSEMANFMCPSFHGRSNARCFRQILNPLFERAFPIGVEMLGLNQGTCETSYRLHRSCA